MIYDTLTALFLAVAGFSLVLRHILLSPENVSFPCAPEAVRAAMFIFAAILLWAAVLFWFSPVAGYAGRAAGVVAVLAGTIGLYQMALAWETMIKRRPFPVWQRINRFQRIALRSPPAGD